MIAKSRYDAIVVLGGGVRPDGELPEHVKARFDLALAQQAGEPIMALSAGTWHRPAILDAQGRVLYESTAGGRYLIEHGIDPARIICETTSYDTIGNAYFSRVQIAGPFGWRRLLIVTSQFHMLRTKAIFEWIYSLDASPCYELEFAASPDRGLSEAALDARRTREAASLRAVEALRSRFTTLEAMAKWLFIVHESYRAVRGPLVASEGALLDSY